MNFKDKVVLITGAGSGIGQSAAYLYANQGANVVVADINEANGQNTVQKIEEQGGKASFINVNVADYEHVKQMIQQTIELYGRIDIAINNAGIGGELQKTHNSSNEIWDKVMAVNASGVYYCMKLELEQMLQQGGGCIVNTASVAGLKGLPNAIAYTASKHAVVGMTKTAALEYAKYNIRVNALCPVFTVTNLFQPAIFDQQSPGMSDKLKAGIPMKRFANVEEVANTLIWLTSDESSFITGQSISVDGGLTA